MSWCLYVVECADGSLYCGITNDLERRLKQHNDGKGAKYTRARRPVQLKTHWSKLTHKEAARAEYFFKRLNRRQKERSVRDPNWPLSVLKDRRSADDSSPDSAE